MKIRWIITTAFLLGLPSCLEQTRLNCPASYTLTIKRGESRALPDICTTHANPAATWDLAARDVSLMGTTSMGLPPGLELVVDATDPARASLVLRETEEAAADSPPYEIRLSAAPRYFRDGDVERPCVDSPTSCGVSDVALRVEFVDEVPFGVEIDGVGDDGLVLPDAMVTLRARAVGGSGQYTYRWEGWTLVEAAMPRAQPAAATAIFLPEMSSEALELGIVAAVPQLYVVYATDVGSGEVREAHRFVQSRTTAFGVAVESVRYPGAPVSLGCEGDRALVPFPDGSSVERTACYFWFLERANNVETADIDAVVADPLRLPTVVWSSVELDETNGPIANAVDASKRVSDAIAGREGLYRVVVIGEDRRAHTRLYAVGLLPRRY